MKILKKTIIISSVVFMFVPLFAQAQLDPRCFTKEQCTLVRESSPFIDATDAPKGFFEDAKLCGIVPEGLPGAGEIMGFCLPATETATTIGFGGQHRFANIGEFIKFMYKYSLLIATILSILMLIVAGIQWASSGGNSSVIEGAKKRIGGAIIGLLLVVGAYTILSNINPALVNLRLPQVWMVNEIGIAPASCGELETNLALAIERQSLANWTPEQANQQIKTNLKTAKYTVKPEKTICGSKYFVPNMGEQTCEGVYCEKSGMTCRQSGIDIPECIEGHIIGTVYNSDIASSLVAHADNIFADAGAIALLEKWTWEEDADEGDDSIGWVHFERNDSHDRDFDLYDICEDGYFRGPTQARVKPVEYSANTENLSVFYQITFNESKVNGIPDSEFCDDHEGFKGYLLRIRPQELVVNDYEWHFIGKRGVDIAAYGYDSAPYSINYQLYFAQTLLCQTDKSLFFTADDILKGVELNIDMARVRDPDNISDESDGFLQLYPSMDAGCKNKAKTYFDARGGSEAALPEDKLKAFGFSDL